MRTKAPSRLCLNTPLGAFVSVSATRSGSVETRHVRTLWHFKYLLRSTMLAVEDIFPNLVRHFSTRGLSTVGNLYLISCVILLILVRGRCLSRLFVLMLMWWLFHHRYVFLLKYIFRSAPTRSQPVYHECWTLVIF